MFLLIQILRLQDFTVSILVDFCDFLCFLSEVVDILWLLACFNDISAEVSLSERVLFLPKILVNSV